MTHPPPPSPPRPLFIPPSKGRSQSKDKQDKKCGGKEGERRLPIKSHTATGIVGRRHVQADGPLLIWRTTSVQHFGTPKGQFDPKELGKQCRPLDAFYKVVLSRSRSMTDVHTRARPLHGSPAARVPLIRARTGHCKIIWGVCSQSDCCVAACKFRTRALQLKGSADIATLRYAMCRNVLREAPVQRGVRAVMLCAGGPCGGGGGAVQRAGC